MDPMMMQQQQGETTQPPPPPPPPSLGLRKFYPVHQGTDQVLYLPAETTQPPPPPPPSSLAPPRIWASPDVQRLVVSVGRNSVIIPPVACPGCYASFGVPVPLNHGGVPFNGGA